MSYLMYQVQCKDCGEIYNTAFGIVGMRIIADPLQKCPKCGGAVERCADEWSLDKSKVNKTETYPLKSRLGVEVKHPRAWRSTEEHGRTSRRITHENR